MTYTEEELKIAQEWDNTAKFRSDIHSDIYSFIEGMRYVKNLWYWNYDGRKKSEENRKKSEENRKKSEENK